MDLSILVQDTILYIRVAGLVKTQQGYLFEKSTDGSYIYTLGGKVKINETSEEAIKREIMEEIGMEVKDLTLCSVMENIYQKKEKKVHEICFIYSITNIFEDTLPEGFVEVLIDDIGKFDIRPSSIVEILQTEGNSFKHIIQN